MIKIVIGVGVLVVTRQILKEFGSYVDDTTRWFNE